MDGMSLGEHSHLSPVTGADSSFMEALQTAMVERSLGRGGVDAVYLAGLVA
jgi:hypothetical protein